MINSCLRYFCRRTFKLEKMKIKELENADILKMKHDAAKNFFTGSIIFRYDEESKKIFFLVLNYRRDGVGPLQIKFPGGCSQNGETPHETLIREMQTESGLVPAKDSAEIINHQSLAPRALGDPEHHKIFFLVRRYTGILKTVTGSDAGEASAPYWEEADALSKTIFKGHRPAFKRVIELLMHKKEYALSLMHVRV